MGKYDRYAKIQGVINDPAFQGFGQLLFPVDEGFYSGSTLEQFTMVFYNYHDPFKTVEIVNTLEERASAGEKVFFDIYSPEEKKNDPTKEKTGLFFFQGDPGAKTAVVIAGGGQMFVGAMHDSFPHALELSKMGYNAFCPIYRAGMHANEDMARAIVFLFEHAEELQIDLTGYSVWGGSAGARMAAMAGSFTTRQLGEQEECPRPATVVLQYTGLSEVFGNEPPTFACVGMNDWIANYQVMQERIEKIRKSGTPCEIEVYPGMPHGFGIGTGTAADGWVRRAADFWKKNS
ncbi:MAG: alpha/beta hydrolase [Firmicutes bacterium]|nr:alpha/beta hydrolase [Bacillota bacterium]